MAVPLKRVTDVAANPSATAGDISVTVDPASAVPLPPADTVFVNQAEVDTYLTANSGTAFKHIQDYLDTLPSLLVHEVDVTMVAGVHRPRDAGTYRYLIDLARDRISHGKLKIHGAPVADYDTVHAGGTIRAHQTLDEITGVKDPYVDCDALTFPNDGSLQGRMAVTSDGFVSQIWKHTDSRLYLCRKLDPVPVDDTTTVAVKQPATRLRNSFDDIARAESLGCVKVDTGASTPYSTPQEDALPPDYERNSTIFQDLLVEDFGCSSPILLTGDVFSLNRVIIDKQFGPAAENGYGYRCFSTADVSLNDCSYLSTLGGGADGGLGVYFRGGITGITCSYFQGGDDYSVGVDGDSGPIHWYASVIREGGDTGKAAFGIEGSVAQIAGYTMGVIPTIVGSPGPGVEFFNKGKTILNGLRFELRFEDTVGPCIIATDGTLLTLTSSWGVDTKILDGGGNLDVGFLIRGPLAALTIDSPDVTVTGANGDVQFENDSSIWSYSQINVLGPLTDDRGNIVEVK